MTAPSTIWLVMENAPDAGEPDSAWTTQEKAEERARALSAEPGPYDWYAAPYPLDLGDPGDSA